MAGERAVRGVSVAAAGPLAPVVAAGAVLLVLLLLFALVGASAILLLGCVVAGFGITYLSGVALNLEERLAFGTVIGAMAVAGSTFTGGNAEVCGGSMVVPKRSLSSIVTCKMGVSTCGTSCSHT